MKKKQSRKKIINKKIPYQILDKREGDSAIAIADVKMANQYLNWQAKRNLKEMCYDSWRWQMRNLDGYFN